MKKLCAVLLITTGAYNALSISESADQFNTTATPHSTPAEPLLLNKPGSKDMQALCLEPGETGEGLIKAMEQKKKEEIQSRSPDKKKVTTPHKGNKPLMSTANGQR